MILQGGGGGGSELAGEEHRGCGSVGLVGDETHLYLEINRPA